MIQLELETFLGKALIEEMGYSLLKINNAEYESLRLPEMSIFKWSGYIPVANQDANSYFEVAGLYT